MRLDRYISHATGLSRSLAQRAVRKGEVRVDDVVVKDPGMHVDESSRVEYLDDTVVVLGPQYVMLHKPIGYVCAARDSGHRTVLDLIELAGRAELHMAGRLDIDTTGLVLLTDDGEWSHRVTSPRHKVEKVYRATLAEPLSERSAQLLRQGVQLQGEPKPCAPATVEPIADNEWKIVITEGKYHQVRRMFTAVGNNVLTLHRERIGRVALDPALKPGEWRPLTKNEIDSFGSAHRLNAD